MFLALTNTPRDYAWGSTTGIADFLGTEAPGTPEAELWLGTHAGSPSHLRDAPGTLPGALSADPSLAGGDLPILLKVLAAASPLSLQVHPTPEQAVQGFADEEARGIPISSPTRNYKDASAKPEIIVAVSDRFDALCGFRPAYEVEALVAYLRREGDATALRPLLDILDDPTAVEQALRWLLSGEADVAPAVVAVHEVAESHTRGAEPSVDATLATAREIAAHYPGDPGIVIAMLMNRVSLRRGECLFAPAGLLHAYLEGVGVELMTASDNVVRGGLTPKHIDTAELVRLLSFTQAPAEPLVPSEPSPGIRHYEPDAPFSLWSADAALGADTVPLAGPALIIAERGEVTVSGGGDTITLPRGGSAFVSADTARLKISGSGILWVAVAEQA